MPEQGSKELQALIIKADDLPTEKLNIPEWGIDVWVRTLTGLERSELEASMIQDGKIDQRNIYAKLAVLVLVDGNGNRIFPNADQAMALGQKSSKALNMRNHGPSVTGGGGGMAP